MTKASEAKKLAKALTAAKAKIEKAGISPYGPMVYAVTATCAQGNPTKGVLYVTTDEVGYHGEGEKGLVYRFGPFASLESVLTHESEENTSIIINFPDTTLKLDDIPHAEAEAFLSAFSDQVDARNEGV